MKFIDNVEKKEYEKFVSNHKTKSHFLQSYSWGDFCKENKHNIPYYVGLIDDKKKLVATALLLERKLPLGYSYFYSPRGFVCDYNNKDVIEELTKGTDVKKKNSFVRNTSNNEYKNVEVKLKEKLGSDVKVSNNKIVIKF